MPEQFALQQIGCDCISHAGTCSSSLIFRKLIAAYIISILQVPGHMKGDDAAVANFLCEIKIDKSSIKWIELPYDGSNQHADPAMASQKTKIHPEQSRDVLGAGWTRQYHLLLKRSLLTRRFEVVSYHDIGFVLFIAILTGTSFSCPSHQAHFKTMIVLISQGK